MLNARVDLGPILDHIVSEIGLKSVLEHIGTGDVLAEIGEKKCVEHFGKSILDEIGENECVAYFEIEVADESYS